MHMEFERTYGPKSRKARRKGKAKQKMRKRKRKSHTKGGRSAAPKGGRKTTSCYLEEKVMEEERSSRENEEPLSLKLSQFNITNLMTEFDKTIGYDFDDVVHLF